MAGWILGILGAIFLCIFGAIALIAGIIGLVSGFFKALFGK